MSESLDSDTSRRGTKMKNGGPVPVTEPAVH